MLVDHGFIVPMALMWRHLPAWPVKGIPLAVNTVQHPIPTARRCYALGKALRKAVESYPEDLKVVIFGTGGMSHQLQGERAGFINVD
jgi:protocatechuate 4,5-dioxygenase beta chain